MTKNLRTHPAPPGCWLAARSKLGSGAALVRLAIGLVGTGLLASAASYQPVGGDFPLITAQAGDQVSPALAFGKDGRGYVVWSDNTDGSGSGIGAQGYSQNGIRTGQSFRINSTIQGDQTEPAIAVLADGSAFIAWQSGSVGTAAVYGRMIGADGILRNEIRISDADKDVRTISVAAAGTGGALVVWSQANADASDFGVLSRAIGSDGTATAPIRLVNSYSPGNQRGSTVAALVGGGYVAAWSSEGQSGGENVDIVARRIAADGTPTGSEVTVSRSRTINQSATVQGLPNGGFVVAWCTLNGLPIPAAGGSAAAQATLTLNHVVEDVSKVVWGVVARSYDSSANPTGGEAKISNREKDSQLHPRIASNGDSLAFVWNGNGLDGSFSGIGARVYDFALNPLSDVAVINERRRGNQEYPVIVPDGSGSYLVTWANWQGLNSGMDLVAHRLQRLENLLAAPPAPIVEAKSSWQIKAAWAPLLGLPLNRYEVSFDGGDPVSTTDTVVESSDYFPSTSHSVKYRYVLADGRTSPFSPSIAVVTWGKDQNLDGLPDDWQTLYFGSEPRSWPAPNTDSDGDGVSDRDEFLAGTDPTNPADSLKVVIGRGFSGKQLSWNAKLGSTYRVQTSGNLSQWADLGEPVFAAETNQTVAVPNLDGVLYFRVLRLR